MIAPKQLLMGFPLIAICLIEGSAFALDGATLYVERACIACHGAEGRAPVMTEYPKIAGQNAEYSLAQIKDIKNGVRTNSHTVAMKNVMHLISDEEMTVVAKWLSELPE